MAGSVVMSVLALASVLILLFTSESRGQELNTWLDCSGDGGNEVYVSTTQETWVAGEQFCQRQGSHLASFPQITACKSSLLSLLGLVGVHTSYTRLLDGLHNRDVGNTLQLSDSLVVFSRFPVNCSITFLGDSLPPEEASCSNILTVVCGRNPAIREPTTVCGSYKFTYVSISFSADDANRTCRQRYGGWLLSTDIQQLSCVSQLLNSSQGLRDNNATTIPLYTSGTTGSAECEVYSPSRSAVLQDSCTAARPTVCVSPLQGTATAVTTWWRYEMKTGVSADPVISVHPHTAAATSYLLSDKRIRTSLCSVGLSPSGEWSVSSRSRWSPSWQTSHCLQACLPSDLLR
eukprot:scpid43712/ scgid1329/ 